PHSSINEQIHCLTALPIAPCGFAAARAPDGSSHPESLTRTGPVLPFLPAPAMDFSLTDDQRLLKETIRQFMEAEVRPHLRQYEKEEHFPADELRRLGELGCCGM